MSLFWGMSDPFAPVYPPHSDDCFTTPDKLCEDCYGLLAPLPIRQRREAWLARERQRRGLDQPLPESFRRALAASLRFDPERFALIIQFLNSYQGGS
jgi:hypothetical protein